MTAIAVVQDVVDRYFNGVNKIVNTSGHTKGRVYEIVDYDNETKIFIMKNLNTGRLETFPLSFVPDHFKCYQGLKTVMKNMYVENVSGSVCIQGDDARAMLENFLHKRVNVTIEEI